LKIPNEKLVNCKINGVDFGDIDYLQNIFSEITLILELDCVISSEEISKSNKMQAKDTLLHQIRNELITELEEIVFGINEISVAECKSIIETKLNDAYKLGFSEGRRFTDFLSKQINEI
jgi:hypothetical protein